MLRPHKIAAFDASIGNRDYTHAPAVASERNLSEAFDPTDCAFTKAPARFRMDAAA